MIKIFPELHFAVVAELEPEYKQSVEYKIYEIVATSCGDDPKPLFQNRNARSHPDPVESIEDAEVYMQGFVKWDGCSNWILQADRKCMLHFCTQESLLNVGKILS